MNQQLKHTLKTYGRELIYALIIPLAAGAFSSVLTPDSSEIFNMLNKPPLSPPALTLYCTQLFLNFMWSIIFFNLQMYLAAFFWLFLMWFLIIITIVLFYEICKPAAYLMIPYLVWVTYAGYLNLAIYMLN